jgi:4-coumarate--CoA ligase
MSITVHHDEKTGIYKTNYEGYNGPSQRSFYDRVLGDISWEEDQLSFVECDKRAKSLTNSSLKLKAQQLGAGLLKNAGLKQGDMVMMIAGNSILFPEVLLAAAFAGLRVALANPAYLPSELKHAISLTQPVKIFVMSPLMKNVSAAGVPWNKIITMDTEIGRGGTLYMQKIKVDEQQAKEAKAYQPKDYNETQFLLFSSGTTGLPKGVDLSHRNLVAIMESIAHVPNSISSMKRHLAVLPFFHAFALLCNVAIPIMVRSTVWIMPSPFDPVKYCEIIEREKIEMLAIVPPLFIVLTNTQQANKETWKSVKFVLTGAAPLDSETQLRLQDKTGVDVRTGWGMTETSVGGLGLHDNFKIGTCGKPLPGLEVSEQCVCELHQEADKVHFLQAKCVDVETGKPVKRGERGELWVRAPNVFKVSGKRERENTV